MEYILDALDGLSGEEAREALRHMLREPSGDVRMVAVGLVSDAIEAVTAPMVPS